MFPSFPYWFSGRAMRPPFASSITVPGDIVQHFKIETLSKKDRDKNIYLYKIIGIAKHTETKEMVVVYQSLYGDFAMYVRPYDMFIGKVDKEKYPDIKQIYRHFACF